MLGFLSSTFSLSFFFLFFLLEPLVDLLRISTLRFRSPPSFSVDGDLVVVVATDDSTAYSTELLVADSESPPVGIGSLVVLLIVIICGGVSLMACGGMVVVDRGVVDSSGAAVDEVDSLVLVVVVVEVVVGIAVGETVFVGSGLGKVGVVVVTADSTSDSMEVSMIGGCGEEDGGTLLFGTLSDSFSSFSRADGCRLPTSDEPLGDVSFAPENDGS